MSNNLIYYRIHKIIHLIQTFIIMLNNNIKIIYNSIQMNKVKPIKPIKPINVIEVAREWVIKKENEITNETSLFKNVTEILKQRLRDVSIKPNTLHLIIKYIMELIEETPIKGIAQKEFALKVMRELFQDLTEGEDELVLLKLLDDGSISNIIDLVVDATNGKLNINAVIKTTTSCMSICIPYLSGKKNNKTKQKTLNKKN